MLEPRPDWSPLGVNFKILDEHPTLLIYRVIPPREYTRAELDRFNFKQIFVLQIKTVDHRSDAIKDESWKRLDVRCFCFFFCLHMLVSLV